MIATSVAQIIAVIIIVFMSIPPITSIHDQLRSQSGQEPDRSAGYHKNHVSHFSSPSFFISQLSGEYAHILYPIPNLSEEYSGQPSHAFLFSQYRFTASNALIGGLLIRFHLPYTVLVTASMQLPLLLHQIPRHHIYHIQQVNLPLWMNTKTIFHSDSVPCR